MMTDLIAEFSLYKMSVKELSDYDSAHGNNCLWLFFFLWIRRLLVHSFYCNSIIYLTQYIQPYKQDYPRALKI